MRTIDPRLFLIFPSILGLALAIPACGGSDTGGGTESGSSSSSSSSGAADPCAGKACGEPCTDCPAGGCDAQACNSMGQCVAQAEALCSPCPQSMPADGAPCPQTALVCELEDGPILPCRARIVCQASGWQNVAPGCSSLLPADTNCSAPPPTGACDINTDPLLCATPDSFCGCSNCLAGPCGGPAEWVCASPAAAPCPPQAPKLGEICSMEGLKCVYGACALGGTSGGRSCYKGLWIEDIVNCPK